MCNSLFTHALIDCNWVAASYKSKFMLVSAVVKEIKEIVVENIPRGFELLSHSLFGIGDFSFVGAKILLVA